MKRYTRLRNKRGSRFPRRRDKKYKAWIKTLPCHFCGRTWGVDPAHVIKQSQGGYDVDNLIPTCRKCHDAQHDVEWTIDKEEHQAIARDYGALWRQLGEAA